MHPFRLLKHLQSTRQFASSRMKINRARAHIAELEAKWANHVAAQPFIVSVRTEPKLHEFFEVREIPSNDIPAIVGDIIHNLRVSLDLLASDLVRLNGNDPSKVYFPFANSADAFKDMIKRRKLDLADPKAVDLVKSLKPYEGGNPSLRGIHDLDIIDKHQSLLLTITKTGNERAQFGMEHFTLKVGPLGWNALYDSTQPYEGKVLPVQLTFPLGLPFGGEEVLSTLKRLTDELQSIIEKFEKLIWGE